MKFSIACACGYETPPVESDEAIDHELLDAHLEFCVVANATCEECGGQLHPEFYGPDGPENGNCSCDE